MRNEGARFFAWFSRATALVLLGMAVFGFELAAQASDGTIDFPGMKFVGPFVHNPDNFAIGVFAKYFPGEKTNSFVIQAGMKTGESVKLRISDSLPNLSKPPKTYIFDSSRGHPASIEGEVKAGGMVCGIESGSLTLTGFSAVDGTVTGILSKLKWFQPDCAKFGSSATFKVQRAADLQ